MDCNFNYIFKCWNEFTTLTEEERENLRRLVSKDKYYQQYGTFNAKIICLNTGRIFKNLSAAAEFFGLSKTALTYGLKKDTYTIQKGLYKGFTIERV